MVKNSQVTRVAAVTGSWQHATARVGSLRLAVTIGPSRCLQEPACALQYLGGVSSSHARHLIKADPVSGRRALRSTHSAPRPTLVGPLFSSFATTDIRVVKLQQSLQSLADRFRGRSVTARRALHTCLRCSLRQGVVVRKGVDAWVVMCRLTESVRSQGAGREL